MRRLLHRPKHLTALGGGLVLASCAAVIYLTHFNIGAVISVTVILSAVPASIVFGVQGVLQGVVAGFQLRGEGKLVVGRVIVFNNLRMRVAQRHVRVVDFDLADGEWTEPYAVLLAEGFGIPNDQTTLSPMPVPPPLPAPPSVPSPKGV